MEPSHRLALAVNARVTELRVEYLYEQLAHLGNRLDVVHRALDDYERLDGYEVNSAERFDEVMVLVARYGGAHLTRDDVNQGVLASRMVRLAAADAAQAMRELACAMTDYRGTVLDWVGCTARQFDAAVTASLSAPPPSTDTG